MFVYNFLGFGHEPLGEVIRCSLSILNMFFFAFLYNITRGGSYNPLTVLASAISGDFRKFLFTVSARIPAQVSSFSVLGWVSFFGLRIGFDLLGLNLADDKGEN